jgi:hypothetical protein
MADRRAQHSNLFCLSTKNTSIPCVQLNVCLLYVFFLVIPRSLNFICRRFGTICLFHLYRQIGVEFYIYLPMKMEQTECFETSAYKIQTPGNYPEENIKHTENGESLKSDMFACNFCKILKCNNLSTVLQRCEKEKSMCVGVSFLSVYLSMYNFLISR